MQDVSNHKDKRIESRKYRPFPNKVIGQDPLSQDRSSSQLQPIS